MMDVEIKSEYDGYRLYYPETDEVFQWVDVVKINESQLRLTDEMSITAETVETMTDTDGAYPKHVANIRI